MTTTRKKKKDLKTELRVARAQLRGLLKGLESLAVDPYTPKGDFNLKATVTPQVFHAPSKFIQCWAVTRGYASITQALDSEGQVWERVMVVETVGTSKQVTDSWWEPLSMDRREKPAGPVVVGGEAAAQETRRRRRSEPDKAEPPMPTEVPRVEFGRHPSPHDFTKPPEAASA
ncbi:MAG TPA: hypothetical protein VMT97_14785 [Terriglobales bacterium]|nr:hypothetical protein [Terriglobales bacterium]